MDRGYNKIVWIEDIKKITRVYYVTCMQRLEILRKKFSLKMYRQNVKRTYCFGEHHNLPPM